MESKHGNGVGGISQTESEQVRNNLNKDLPVVDVHVAERRLNDL